jgi:adenine-specific DNA-methyltransferase
VTARWWATVRGLQDAVEQLKRLGSPFLNWAGKAERLSFDVPTLPLFIHERLSTRGIIEPLKGHRKSRMEQMDRFGDPQHSITDQVLKAYEYRDKWVNRLILGDSLVVMNSLLHCEGLGGQVQMTSCEGLISALISPPPPITWAGWARKPTAPSPGW